MEETLSEGNLVSEAANSIDWKNSANHENILYLKAKGTEASAGTG